MSRFGSAVRRMSPARLKRLLPYAVAAVGIPKLAWDLARIVSARQACRSDGSDTGAADGDDGVDERPSAVELIDAAGQVIETLSAVLVVIKENLDPDPAVVTCSEACLREAKAAKDELDGQINGVAARVDPTMGTPAAKDKVACAAAVATEEDADDGKQVKAVADDDFLAPWHDRIKGTGYWADGSIKHIFYKVAKPADKETAEIEVNLREMMRCLSCLAEIFEELLVVQRQTLAIADLRGANKVLATAAHADPAERAERSIAEGTRVRSIALLKSLDVGQDRQGIYRFLWQHVSPDVVKSPIPFHVGTHFEVPIWRDLGALCGYNNGHLNNGKRGPADWFTSLQHRRKWAQDYHPRKHPQVLCLFEPTIRRSTEMWNQADIELRGLRMSRLWKLYALLTKVVGTRKQRTLFALSMTLDLIKTMTSTSFMFYRTSMLAQSVAMVASAGGSGSPARSGPKLGDVIKVMLWLKVLSALCSGALDDINKLNEQDIRASLNTLVLRQVLGQDIQDLYVPPLEARQTGQGPEQKPGQVDPYTTLLSIDERGFGDGLGAVVKMPQKILIDTTALVTQGMLLWQKSPKLVAMVYGTMIVQAVVKKYSSRLFDAVGPATLTDVIQQRREPHDDTQDVFMSLLEFDDLRVNAMEGELMLSMEKSTKAKSIVTEDKYEKLVSGVFTPVTSVLGEISAIASAYLGGLFALNGQINAVDLANFVAEVQLVMQLGGELSDTASGICQLDGEAFKKSFEICDLLSKKPKIGLEGGGVSKPLPPRGTLGGAKGKVGATASNLSRRQLADPKFRLNGDIEFDAVSFRYPGKQQNMLQSVSFKIKAGSFVGVCGARGGGKSTLFKLLMRLYDPMSGCVKVDGRDVKDYNPLWLRSQIGLAKQEPAIFQYGAKATLVANLKYGSEKTLKRLPSEREGSALIEQALKDLEVWDHFTGTNFPQKLDQVLTGHELSGGEKRSIGNVRAMLTCPAVVLLDEPTEGLDARNEDVVRKVMITNRPAGQTVLAIAHRLSTIRDADKILFLGPDGSIAEQGTWKELIELDGAFKAFVDYQDIGDDAAGPVQAAAAGGASIIGVPHVPEQSPDSPGPKAPLSPFSQSLRLQVPEDTARSHSVSAPMSASLAWQGLSDAIHDGTLRRALCPDSIGSIPDNGVTAAADEAIEMLRRVAADAGVPPGTSALLDTVCSSVRDFSRLTDISRNLMSPAGSRTGSRRLDSRPHMLPGTPSRAMSWHPSRASRTTSGMF